LPKTYIETSSFLLEEIDEMVQEGFYHDRTEAVNDALRLLIKQYKLSKLHAKDARYAASSDVRASGSGNRQPGAAEDTRDRD
jgi:Arc/MetJ-type ribon-helix-helix transcriptional regulator